MADYRIEYSNIVIKEHIPALSAPVKSQIQKAIETKLARNPITFGKPLRHSLKGHRRLRVGDWRIIYRIDETSRAVLVIAIGHRRDIYDA